MKKRMVILIVLGGFVILPWIACNTSELSNVDCDGIPASYAADVKPIITANCSSSGCHGTGSQNGDYTTYAGLKIVADNGHLNKRLNVHRDMPPTAPLHIDDRKKIKCWINNGALNN